MHLPDPSWKRKPLRHLRHCLFSLVRNPGQQPSTSKAATEEFVGMELFMPGFEGERKRSTRPAMRVLTAGTARAYIHDLMPPRPLSGRPVILPRPHLYFLFLFLFLSLIINTPRPVVFGLRGCCANFYRSFGSLHEKSILIKRIVCLGQLISHHHLVAKS